MIMFGRGASLVAGGGRERVREGAEGREREKGRAVGGYLVKELLLISQSAPVRFTCPLCRSRSCHR